MLTIMSIAASLIADATRVRSATEPEGVRLTREAPATANLLAPVIRTKEDPETQLAARPRMQNSPTLAVDPTDPRFVVLANRVDAPDFSCDLQVSGNGGAGWVPAQPVPRLPKGAEKCYGPEVAFDRSGTLYYLFVGLHTAGNEPMGVFLTTSTDRGHTFSTPRRVLGPFRFQVRMVFDPDVGSRGRLHLVWLQATDPPLGGLPLPPNPIMAAYSDDGGKTFSEPVQVSDPRRPLVVAPAVTLGPDHALHVVYYDLRDDMRDYQGLEGPTFDGTWSLVLASSFDGGHRFSATSIVEEAVVPPERVLLIFTMAPPAVAADASGRLYVAWHDARQGDWDVFLRVSGDAGSTWGKLRRLNDTPESDGSHQYLVRLDLAPGGRLDAIFYDRRGDPENLRSDVSYTWSDDGGRHFSPNVVLTSAPSDARIGPVYPAPPTGLVDFGSRLGLVSSDAKAIAAWTDTRNAVLAGQQDIFTRQVLHRWPADNPGSDIMRVIALLMATAAAVGAGLVVRRRTRTPRMDHSGQSEHTGVPVTRRRRLRIPSAMVAGLTLFGCRHAAAPLPRTPSTVTFSLSEYRLGEQRVEVNRGRVVFNIKNEGGLGHQLTFFRIPEGLPGTLDEQLHSPRRLPASPLAVLPTLAPNGDTTIALDLEPGRYGVVCFLKDDDGTVHALKGMNAEVSVR